VILVLILEVLEGLLGLPENVFPPSQQLLPEIVALAIIHERLFVSRPIGFALIRTHLFRLPGAKLIVFVRELHPAAGLYSAAPPTAIAKTQVYDSDH
jgi:hypothetical protein